MLFCPGRVIAVYAAFAWSYVAVVAIDICLATRGLYDGALSLLWALYFGGVGAKKKSEYASTADSGPAIRHC